MHPPDLVQELGHRLNLTGLTLHDGVCRLVFDQSLPIDLEDDGLGNLCFHAVVATLPHEGREVVLSALLSAHLFGLETDGAVFGLHPETDELYLFRSLPVDTLTVDHALDVLERFTQQVESWTEKIKSLVREASPTSHGSEHLGTEALRA